MRYSVIGTSWITEMFIEAAKKTGEAKLISVYSRNEETARNFASKYGGKDLFTNLDEMLEDESDFVYIASPNSLHYEHVMKSINKNKHVFCEKPMAYKEEQVQEIVAAAKENGVFVFEGYRHLYSPNYRVLKESIKNIGMIRGAFFPYLQYSSRYDQYKDGKIANVFSKEFAGGALMDLGVYPLSMAIDLFGEPNTLSYSPIFLSNGIDGSGTLVLNYEEFNVTILTSKITASTLPAEIQGEEATITMNHIAPIRNINIIDRKLKNTRDIAGPQEELDMVYEIQEFIDRIKGNDQVSFEKWLIRSLQVAKWSEQARHQSGILFPGE